MSKIHDCIDLGRHHNDRPVLSNEKIYEIVGKLTWAHPSAAPGGGSGKRHWPTVPHLAQDNKVDFCDIKICRIGTPGSVNFTTGFVGFNTNFGYYDWNLGPDLEALLGCKVYVENDANAAAYGEYIAGGAKGYNDAVVITLGTGIGSGIILGGKIFARLQLRRR